MPAHDYRLADGTRVQGTTTIISQNLGWSKGGLIHWAWALGKEGKDYRKVKEEAADIGTFVHAMVEADLNDQPIPTPPIEMAEIANRAFAAFLEFKKLTNLTTVAVEVPLVSETWKFGGTIDRVVFASGKLSVLDLKTSKEIYPDMLVQLAAYSRLWAENHPDQPIESYYILKLDKASGGFSWTNYPNLDRYWDIFKLLLDLARFKKEVG